MKRITILTILIVFSLCSAFAFTACGKNGETSGEEALVMDKRYINEFDAQKDEEKQKYYVFHSDGTGEYVYHYDYDYVSSYLTEHVHRHYIIHFKYTYVDNEKSSVVCFYDRLERLEGDDSEYNSTSWSELVTVSKNVLSTIGTSYVFWINADYLKTIPNFHRA